MFEKLSKTLIKIEEIENIEIIKKWSVEMSLIGMSEQIVQSVRSNFIKKHYACIGYFFHIVRLLRYYPQIVFFTTSLTNYTYYQHNYRFYRILYIFHLTIRAQSRQITPGPLEIWTQVQLPFLPPSTALYVISNEFCVRNYLRLVFGKVDFIQYFVGDVGPPKDCRFGFWPLTALKRQNTTGFLKF